MRPSAAILQRLNGFRLKADVASLSVRPGERRSRAKGQGLEFAGHRAYREGDDLRHLDTRLFARTRTPYLREYLADRQLRVAVLIDTSVSMETGTSSKRATAEMLAGFLGHAALAAGDLLEVGMAQGSRINWSDAMQGSSRTDVLLQWIAANRASAAEPFPGQIRAALPYLRNASLCILISDWWLDDPEHDMSVIGAFGRRCYSIQVFSPEEENPLLLGQGPLRLADAESGETIDFSIDPGVVPHYRALFSRYGDFLRRSLEGRGGRFMAVRTDMDAGELFGAFVRGGLLEQYGGARAGALG